MSVLSCLTFRMLALNLLLVCDRSNTVDISLIFSKGMALSYITVEIGHKVLMYTFGAAFFTLTVSFRSLSAPGLPLSCSRTCSKNC